MFKRILAAGTLAALNTVTTASLAATPGVTDDTIVLGQSAAFSGIRIGTRTKICYIESTQNSCEDFSRAVLGRPLT